MALPLIDSESPETGMNRDADVFDIAVTGIGLVTPLGLGCQINLERLLSGDSAVKDEIPAGVEASNSIASARCPDFDLGTLLRFPKSTKYMSRPVQLAMRAAIEAFQSSALDRSQLDPYRLAVYTASGQTGLDYKEFSRALEVAWTPDHEPDFRHLGGVPTKLIDPYFSLRTLANGGIGLLCAEFEAKGPSSNFVHSDTAAALALQAACHDLSEDRCDAAIVGGFDCLLYPTALFALSEAGILAGEAAQFPHMIPAEGAAFFVMERRSDARSRGADIIGEILSIECSVEPCFRDSGQAAALGIPRLLRRLPPSCRSFQFAVSPGTAPRGSVMDAVGQGPTVSCMTRLTGYLGTATAAVEFALGLLSAREGFVPSPVNAAESAASPIEGNDPTGVFFSGSWSGQIAAIVARASSAERKVSSACVP